MTYLEFCLSSELVKEKCCFLHLSFFKLEEGYRVLGHTVDLFS